MEKCRDNIYLIGFVGTGKTVIGRRLAEKLARIFYDTDEEVEKKCGCRVSDVFRDYGERYFRRVETEVLREIANKENCVVATGGGVVLDASNRELLKTGMVIALDADVETIYHRVTGFNDRPLLAGVDLKKRIKLLKEERADFYRKADFYLDTGDLGIEEAVEIITGLLKEGT